MTSFANLNSENQDLKNKMALVILQLEAEGVTNFEEQIAVLMVNMMNFFAKHVDDIPAFDFLTQEQQDFVIKKFKNVAQSLKSKKIKSIEEMVQIFVFTVLSALEERAESLASLTIKEITSKKSKAGFQEFLRQAAAKEIYRTSNSSNTNLISKKDFLYNTVLFGLNEAMNLANLNIKYEELHKDALKILNVNYRNKENSLYVAK